MTFASIESSVEDGQPIVLYQFALGAKVWRYTSADTDQLAGGNLWKAVPISDNGPKQTGEAVTDALTITAPSTIGPAVLYAASAPSTPIDVVMFMFHKGSTDIVAFYAGEIDQIGFNSTPGVASIVCTTLSASMAREGLRLGWQKTCPYRVFDPLTCKLSPAAHTRTATILSTSGFTIEVDSMGAEPDGKYAGGYFQFTHPTKGAEYRTIESKSGNNLLVFGTVDDLFPGLSITILPGCMNTAEACNAYGNYDNYGGEPLLPGKSPFDGTPVF